MSSPRPAIAYRLLTEAIEALSVAGDQVASDDDLLCVLTMCEGTTRRVDRVAVATVASLSRRGTFAERGYGSVTSALADLLGWEHAQARRYVTVAEHVCARIGLDGTQSPARLPATAALFDTGRAGLRHVETIAKILATAAAGRLSPQVWACAEAELAAKAADYTPGQLLTYGTALVDALDQDGAEPDDHPPARTNELHLRRHRGAPGGTLKGRFDDAALYDAIATVIDAKARPLTADDDRPTPQRQAEALAEVCGYVLDHGDVPECGGRRPHLNVIIRLEDLENRARAAALDLGGTLSAESLRMLACDAAVIPIVMNGAGQPLDVGRATRTIPDGLRRAVTTRDRGCAHPGCDRTPSWCEIHHVREWEAHGETALRNLVMLCRIHHRQLHHSEWLVHIRDGLPEFVPPAWIDPEQRPRRKPLPHLIAAA
ncbi:MAG: HNH endonuclease [Pseudonocardia sp.]|nr:HNH endonuclease [Pseudonocardia sp.]